MQPQPTTKRCSRCGEIKPLDSFHRRSASADGRQGMCKPCGSAYVVERRTIDPERERAKHARQRARIDRATLARWHWEWIKANPERARAIAARHHAKNGDARRALSRRWYAANAERAREAGRAWKAAHPDERADQDALRRARKRNALVAPVSRRAIYERDGGRCGICGKPVPYERMHLDHIIPLARGGTHEPRNVQTTHQRCNNRKYVTGPGQLRLLD